jgi:hypothetical protein
MTLGRLADIEGLLPKGGVLRLVSSTRKSRSGIRDLQSPRASGALQSLAHRLVLRTNDDKLFEFVGALAVAVTRHETDVSRLPPDVKGNCQRWCVGNEVPSLFDELRAYLLG